MSTSHVPPILLQESVSSLQRAIASAKAAPDVPRATLAAYHYNLGRAYYARGGLWRQERKYAFSALMEAGRVAWRGQGAALMWLGRY